MAGTNVLSVAFQRVLARCTSASKLSYTDAWRRWKERSSAHPKDWNPALVAQMHEKLIADFSPATARLTFTVAKRVWRESQVLGAVAEEAPYPFRHLRVRIGGTRGNVPEWNVLQQGELERLEAALAAHPRDLAIVRALARQGWRVSELCKLQWEDLSVDNDGDTIAQFIGKGNKPARVQVYAKVLESAQTWAGTRRTGPFIAANKSGTPLDRLTVNKLVNGWTKRTLGHRVTPHGLRATFISAAIEAVGIEEARKLARHEDIKTTGRYSRWATKKLKVELKF